MVDIGFCKSLITRSFSGDFGLSVAPPKAGVTGSNPVGRANKINGLYKYQSFNLAFLIIFKADLNPNRTRIDLVKPDQ